MGEIGDLEFGIHKKFKKCIFLPIERAGTNKFFGKSCSVGRKKSGQTAHCALWCYLLDGIFFIFYFFPAICWI